MLDANEIVKNIFFLPSSTCCPFLDWSETLEMFPFLFWVPLELFGGVSKDSVVMLGSVCTTESTCSLIVTKASPNKNYNILITPKLYTVYSGTRF